jgi:uncharacterized membrane protein YfcA
MRQRSETWRLALNLSVVAFVGGVLLLLVGAWASAATTFVFGVVCAAVALLLVRKSR